MQLHPSSLIQLIYSLVQIDFFRAIYCCKTSGWTSSWCFPLGPGLSILDSFAPLNSLGNSCFFWTILYCWRINFWRCVLEGRWDFNRWVSISVDELVSIGPKIIFWPQTTLCWHCHWCCDLSNSFFCGQWSGQMLGVFSTSCWRNIYEGPRYFVSGDGCSHARNVSEIQPPEI